jgi:predicted ArsR family transcriptional regulator
MAESLDAESTYLLGLLGEHPGAQFTADPLAAALGLPVVHVRRALARLAEAHSVTAVGPGRYRWRDPSCGHRGGGRSAGTPALRRAGRRSMIEWDLCRTVLQYGVCCGLVC